MVLPVCLLLAACTAPESPSTPDPVAPQDRDRESWGVRLQLYAADMGTDSGHSSRANQSVTVEAPYITDQIDEQLSRADSGVTVTLADSARQVTTRLSAHRLVVDHRAHTVALAGSVQARSPARNVTLYADTLIWDRTTDLLQGPTGVRVELSSGQLSAATLSGGSDLAQWTARQVRSTFHDSSADDKASTPDPVQIVAPAARVTSHDAGVVARFDSGRVQWRGRQVEATEVIYDGLTDALRLRGAVRLDDSTRQVRADSVDVELAGSHFVAWGNVTATGQVDLQADELREDSTGRWSAIGAPLQLGVDGRRLQARHMTLSADTDSLSASGAATATEGERTIRADSIRLLRGADELSAEGGIHLQSNDLEGDLQAEHMRIRGLGGVLLLWGEARLRRDREPAEALTLTADTLRLQPDGGGLTGSGAFVLQSPPRVVLQAERGTYQAHQVPVDGTVGEASSDTSLLSGRTTFLYDADGASSRLSADTCQVLLDAGVAVGVIWPVPLKGHVQDAAQTSWLQAQSGRGILVDDRLSTLVLTGQVEVTHKGEADRLSRFTAASMELQYNDKGVLYRVQATGKALVRTRTAGGSLNEVGGERLEVVLTDGAVTAVRVVQAIEGRFVPDGEDSGTDQPGTD